MIKVQFEEIKRVLNSVDISAKTTEDFFFQKQPLPSCTSAQIKEKGLSLRSIYINTPRPLFIQRNM